MSDEYNAELCNVKHDYEKGVLEDHENRLNGHSKRIDNLEQRGERVDTKIENLCDQIKNLVATIKWGLGIFVTVSIFVIGFLSK